MGPFPRFARVRFMNESFPDYPPHLMEDVCPCATVGDGGWTGSKF